MVTLPAVLTPHTVMVRMLEGEGAYGPVYAPESELTRVRLEYGNQLLRGRDGAEVVSTARLFTRPEHGPVPPGSLVLLWPGTAMERWGEVVTAIHQFTPPAPEHYDHSIK